MNQNSEPSSPARSVETTAAAAKRCENCGSAIDTSDWYPVATGRAPDGSLTFYNFDSPECKEAWLADRDERRSAGAA